MIRRIFILASVVSLLLCAATIVLWVRSYQGNEAFCASRYVERIRTQIEWEIYWSDGGIEASLVRCAWKDRAEFERDRAWVDQEPPVPFHRRNFQRGIDGPNRDHGWTWFSVANNTFTEIPSFVTRQLEVDCPFWVVFTLFSVLPAITGLRMWRRWRRSTAGACTNCGYDLRASTDRCPECGTPITATS